VADHKVHEKDKKHHEKAKDQWKAKEKEKDKDKPDSKETGKHESKEKSKVTAKDKPDQDKADTKDKDKNKAKEKAKEKPKKEKTPEQIARAAHLRSLPPQQLFYMHDIRVGKILKAEKHPNGDTLYVESIDVGDEKPRQVVSGILKFYKVEELVGSLVLVICNLNPVVLRGVESFGMVLAASSVGRTAVELIRPPENSTVGERIRLQNTDGGLITVEASIDGKDEDSVWALMLSQLRTDDQCVATVAGDPMLSSRGECRCKSLKGSSIA